MAGMRGRLIHDYFGVDFELVWDVVQNPVPVLRDSDARTAAATDGLQILQLYDQLMTLAPSPVVALNRAVAVAEIEGAGPALALVERLDLDQYYLFHAIRADFLRRLNRRAEGSRPMTRRSRGRETRANASFSNDSATA